MFTFKALGRTFEFVMPTDMNIREQREVKRISGGMTTKAAQLAIAELDGDAMLAVLYVSMRRLDPGITEDQVGELNSVSIMTEINEQIEAAANAAAETALPPPVAVAEAPAQPTEPTPTLLRAAGGTPA